MTYYRSSNKRLWCEHYSDFTMRWMDVEDWIA